MAEERAQRRLAAIVAADVVGYSRLMGEDETGTLAALKAHRKELIEPKSAEYHGRIVKLIGDGTLMEFGSAVDAVLFAVDVQRAIVGRNAEVPEDRRITYRIGINIGDIIIDGDDIYGDGVNVAARLEGLADPGGVCVSRTVYDHIKGKVDLGFEDLGEQKVKNIREPVQVYRVKPDDTDTQSVALGTVGEALPLPDKPSVAVLPFVNMSGDPEQEYFSDGISENIITGLTRFRELLVIAGKSSVVARDGATDVQEIGHRLGVAHIVEGSVRKAGNRVRVTAQLIDAASGHRVWAEHYDRDLDDIFAVQDEITDIIVATLAGRIEEAGRQRAAQKPVKDMVSYDYLLRGRQCMKRATKDGMLEARRYFERALELDPEFATAYANLALSFMYEYESDWTDTRLEALGHAYNLAEKAVALDRDNSIAWLALAWAQMSRDQHDLANVAIDRAIALNPNDYDNLCIKGWCLALSGDPAECITCMNEAIRINPFAPVDCLIAMGIAEYTARHYEAGIETFGKITGAALLKYACLAACYAQLGRDGEARAASAEALELAKTELAAQSGAEAEGLRTYLAAMFHFQDPTSFEHLLDGLRKAGLPE